MRGGTKVTFEKGCHYESGVHPRAVSVDRVSLRERQMFARLVGWDSKKVTRALKRGVISAESVRLALVKGGVDG